MAKRKSTESKKLKDLDPKGRAKNVKGGDLGSQISKTGKQVSRGVGRATRDVGRTINDTGKRFDETLDRAL